MEIGNGKFGTQGAAFPTQALCRGGVSPPTIRDGNPSPTADVGNAFMHSAERINPFPTKKIILHSALSILYFYILPFGKGGIYKKGCD